MGCWRPNNTLSHRRVRASATGAELFRLTWMNICYDERTVVRSFFMPAPISGAGISVSIHLCYTAPQTSQWTWDKSTSTSGKFLASRRASGSHTTFSVGKCPASIRLRPSALASRNWLYFKSEVTKVSQPAARASSIIEPQAPPPTATLDTGRPPST